MAREHYETLQQVFDDAYTGIAAQGFVRSVSYNEDGSTLGCVYRGDDGRRCALGHCIPDDRYGPELEGYGGSDLPHILDGLFSDAINFSSLGELQDAHDRARDAEMMKHRLAEFARKRSLTIPDISSAA